MPLSHQVPVGRRGNFQVLQIGCIGPHPGRDHDDPLRICLPDGGHQALVDLVEAVRLIFQCVGDFDDQVKGQQIGCVLEMLGHRFPPGFHLPQILV